LNIKFSILLGSVSGGEVWGRKPGQKTKFWGEIPGGNKMFGSRIIERIKGGGEGGNKGCETRHQRVYGILDSL